MSNRTKKKQLSPRRLAQLLENHLRDTRLGFHFLTPLTADQEARAQFCAAQVPKVLTGMREGAESPQETFNRVTLALTYAYQQQVASFIEYLKTVGNPHAEASAEPAAPVTTTESELVGELTQ